MCQYCFKRKTKKEQFDNLERDIKGKIIFIKKDEFSIFELIIAKLQLLKGTTNDN